jgi:hypothetical protein
MLLSSIWKICRILQSFSTIILSPCALECLYYLQTENILLSFHREAGLFFNQGQTARRGLPMQPSSYYVAENRKR